MRTIKISKNIISKNINFDKISLYFQTNHLALIYCIFILKLQITITRI